jgi:hypothetical protein
MTLPGGPLVVHTLPDMAAGQGCGRLVAEDASTAMSISVHPNPGACIAVRKIEIR